jgi:hypothetical protein
MAAEAAEPPSPPPPRTGEAEAPATPEKRAPADRDEKEQEGAERPEPKRRRARARIAALESVPRASEVAAAAAAAASREDESVGGCDGVEPSFSFHARSFSSAQTTPKFGSFDPGATTVVAAELVAFHLMKASRRRVDSSATEEAGDHRTVAGGDEEAAVEGSDENSR